WGGSTWRGRRRLGGGARVVRAGAAELGALDHRHFHSGAGKARGEGGAGLAGADDDGVEAGGHIGELSRVPGIWITASRNIFSGVKSVPRPRLWTADRVGGRILGRSRNEPHEAAVPSGARPGGRPNSRCLLRRARRRPRALHYERDRT